MRTPIDTVWSLRTNNISTHWRYNCIILATANTQFGQEMSLVKETTHAQRWQYPDRVDKRLFSFIENVWV